MFKRYIVIAQAREMDIPEWSFILGGQETSGLPRSFDSPEEAQTAADKAKADLPYDDPDQLKVIDLHTGEFVR